MMTSTEYPATSISSNTFCWWIYNFWLSRRGLTANTFAVGFGNGLITQSRSNRDMLLALQLDLYLNHIDLDKMITLAQALNPLFLTTGWPSSHLCICYLLYWNKNWHWILTRYLKNVVLQLPARMLPYLPLPMPFRLSLLQLWLYSREKARACMLLKAWILVVDLVVYRFPWTNDSMMMAY